MWRSASRTRLRLYSEAGKKKCERCIKHSRWAFEAVHVNCLYNNLVTSIEKRKKQSVTAPLNLWDRTEDKMPLHNKALPRHPPPPPSPFPPPLPHPF